MGHACTDPADRRRQYAHRRARKLYGERTRRGQQPVSTLTAAIARGNPQRLAGDREPVGSSRADGSAVSAVSILINPVKKKFPIRGLSLFPSRSKHEVPRDPTGLRARRRRNVGVFDLLAVFGIKSFAMTEHGLRRKVIELDELVDEGILVRRVMGYALAVLPPFVGCDACGSVVEGVSRNPKALCE